jgi:hypothetical protein
LRALLEHSVLNGKVYILTMNQKNVAPPTGTNNGLVRVSLAPYWHPLSAIDNFILSCGWTHDQEGFKAPEEWRAALSVNFGKGLHFSRDVAVRLCVQYHENAGIPFAPNTSSDVGNKKCGNNC